MNKWLRRLLVAFGTLVVLAVGGMQQALDMGGGKLWGRVTAGDFNKLEDLFLETKLIKQKSANPADYVVGIPNFFEKVNTFDHEAVIKQAKECKIP